MVSIDPLMALHRRRSYLEEAAFPPSDGAIYGIQQTAAKLSDSKKPSSPSAYLPSCRKRDTLLIPPGRDESLSEPFSISSCEKAFSVIISAGLSVDDAAAFAQCANCHSGSLPTLVVAIASTSPNCRGYPSRCFIDVSSSFCSWSGLTKKSIRPSLNKNRHPLRHAKAIAPLLMQTMLMAELVDCRSDSCNPNDEVPNRSISFRETLPWARPRNVPAVCW